MERKPSGERFAVALILFAITVWIAILLLVTALLVWLTQAIGSLAVAALIAGGCFVLLAAVVYLVSLRETLERLRARAETVYEVARAARSGYEWVMEKLAAARLLCEELRRDSGAAARGARHSEACPSRDGRP